MKKIYLLTLFILAFLERTYFDLGPNAELITAAMILSAYYFGKKESFWLTFAIIATTDRFIGNTNIFLFTWSGFLIPALFAHNLLRVSKNLITDHGSLPEPEAPRSRGRITKKIFETSSLLSVGFASNIFFYLWTNFGVWLLDSWNMYPNTFHGLTLSYVNGLPFLKYQLTSSLIFIPIIFIATELTKLLYNKLHFSPGLRLLKKSFE